MARVKRRHEWRNGKRPSSIPRLPPQGNVSETDARSAAFNVARRRPTRQPATPRKGDADAEVPDEIRPAQEVARRSLALFAVVGRALGSAGRSS